MTETPCSNINGHRLIEYICTKLREENTLLYDSNIIYYLRRMSAAELAKAIEGKQ